MTLQSIGIPSLNLHSPTDILKLFYMTRLFSVTADLEVTQKTSTDVSFTDNNMTVQYVPIRKSSSPSVGSLMNPDSVVQSYICKLHPMPGTLDIKKCIALGVPRGPALAQLKAGTDFVFPDGRIVKSSEVVSPEESGNVFMVVDCPEYDFIQPFLSNDLIQRHSSIHSDPVMIPTHVFHFTPTDVLNDDWYQNWIQNFPETTSHVILNSDNPILGFSNSAGLQLKLQSLNPDLFPSLDVTSPVESQQIIPKRGTRAETLMSIDIRPHPKMDMKSCLKFNPDVYLNELKEIEDFDAAVDNYKKSLSELSSDDDSISSIYPVVTFFGTASAQPGKERNTSCIHVAIDADSSMIMDCGEGSYGQMVRFFGAENIQRELKKIKCIFVSHLHADHHLGLISILQERSKVTRDKLVLIAPVAVKSWLQDYDRIYEKINHLYECILSENLINHPSLHPLLSGSSLSKLETVRVKHCKDSFGISIMTTNDDEKFKIVYSGDAMPSEYLASAGISCDVLIHEATMEDDLIHEAQIKRHSTTSQAIEMGTKMNAKFTILTHFSQRYSKIPLITDLFKKHNVAIAFDNMRIRRNDWKKVVLLNEPLKVMFQEYQKDLLAKGQRREIREKLVLETTSLFTA